MSVLYGLVAGVADNTVCSEDHVRVMCSVTTDDQGVVNAELVHHLHVLDQFRVESTRVSVRLRCGSTIRLLSPDEFGLERAPYYSSFCRWEQQFQMRELRRLLSFSSVLFRALPSSQR